MKSALYTKRFLGNNYPDSCNKSLEFLGYKRLSKNFYVLEYTHGYFYLEVIHRDAYVVITWSN